MHSSATTGVVVQTYTRNFLETRCGTAGAAVELPHGKHNLLCLLSVSRPLVLWLARAVPAAIILEHKGVCFVPSWQLLPPPAL